MFLTSNTTSIMARAPEDRLGIVNGVRLMVQNCGIVIGTALSLALITSPLDAGARRFVYSGDLAHLTGRHVDQLVSGYRWALSVMVVAAVIGGLATWGEDHTGVRRLLPRRRSPTRPRSRTPKAAEPQQQYRTRRFGRPQNGRTAHSLDRPAGADWSQP
jgi:hypothetical protein